MGDQTDAVEALKAVTDRSPDHANGWQFGNDVVTDQVDLAKRRRRHCRGN